MKALKKASALDFLPLIFFREMKRINTLVALLVLIVGTVSAQTKIGIKTELGLTQDKAMEKAYATGESDDVFYALESDGRGNAFSMGLSAKHTAGFIYLSSDVLMTMFDKNFNVKDFGMNSAISGKISQTNVQMDIPIKIGLTAHNFNIAVGPQFQYNLSKSNELNVLMNLDDRTRKFSTGYNMSIGYDFGPIFTDFSFYKNFGGEGEGIYLNGEKAGFKLRSEQFKFAVGYHF